MDKYIKKETAIKSLLNDCLGQVSYSREDAADCIRYMDAADVVQMRHGRCDVCSGNSVLTQDAYNGYSLEIDAEQQEAAVWYGDECLAVFRIDFCPNCGAKMDLED